MYMNETRYICQGWDASAEIKSIADDDGGFVQSENSSSNVYESEEARGKWIVDCSGRRSTT